MYKPLRSTYYTYLLSIHNPSLLETLFSKRDKSPKITAAVMLKTKCLPSNLAMSTKMTCSKEI